MSDLQQPYPPVPPQPHPAPQQASPPSPQPYAQQPFGQQPYPPAPQPYPPAPQPYAQQQPPYAQQQPYAAPAPYPYGAYPARPATGTVAWAMGFLQFIPAVGLLVAPIVMAAMYPSVSRHGGPARENARGAANWGLTVIGGLVVGVLLIVIFGAASGGRGFFPTGIGVILILVVAVMHLVTTIIGTVKASGGNTFAPVYAIPFIRR